MSSGTLTVWSAPGAFQREGNGVGATPEHTVEGKVAVGGSEPARLACMVRVPTRRSRRRSAGSGTVPPLWPGQTVLRLGSGLHPQPQRDPGSDRHHRTAHPAGPGRYGGLGPHGSSGGGGHGVVSASVAGRVGWRAWRCSHHNRVSYTQVMASTATKVTSQPNATQPRIGGS
jgi:hypothetical protein